MGDIIYRTLKLQLYPNKNTQKKIDKSVEILGYVYNFFIYAGKNIMNKTDSLPSKYDLYGLCTKIWQNCPYWHDIYANCMFSAANDALRALKQCKSNTKRCENSEKYPKYKLPTDFSSFAYVSNKGFKLEDILDNNKQKRYLAIGKIGTIRARNLTKMDGIPKVCRISIKRYGNHNEYFATIDYYMGKDYNYGEFPLDRSTKEAIGIDLGLTTVAYLSNGIYYENKLFHQKSLEKLKALHRSLSKCPKNSKVFLKTKTKLVHTYTKISNKRNNTTNIIAKDIVFNNGPIFLEKLSITELKAKSLSRKMSATYNDACLGKLVRKINQLAVCSMHPIAFVNPEGTSQICSNCGKWVQKTLSDRVHKCENCKIILNRDHNAALNILHRGLTGNPVTTETKCNAKMQSTKRISNSKNNENDMPGLNACLFSNKPFNDVLRKTNDRKFRDSL